MKKEFKISICMMIKNEEKNLIRCLESIKPLIDYGLAELIIVDTGSSDKSVEITKKYTKKVYFHEWNNNFSHMRNITISYAKGQWIFILDADERVDNCEELIKLINHSKLNSYNTILVNVKNLNIEDDESKYSLIVSPRIFKNDGEFKYKGSVHNQPIFKKEIFKSHINITHFGYISNDKELMEKKFKRTSEILKSELIKNKNNLYYIYQLAVSYDMYGDRKKSTQEFKKAFNLLREKAIEEKKIHAYIYGAYCRIAYYNNEIKESVEVAKEILNIENEYIDLYYLLAAMEKKLGNREATFEYINKYLSLVNKYSELSISKNTMIIMYYIDSNCISNAYFELYNYYFDKEDYINSYNNYIKLTINEQKIYAGINILIKLEKYEELKNLYNSLEYIEDKNKFLVTLEKKLNNINILNKKEIYNVFSLNEDIYGELNKLRLIDNENEREKISISLINDIDFNDSPLFYSEIFKYLKNNISLIIEKFKNIEVLYLKNIINELIKDSDIKEEFENYILESKNKINNIEYLKVKNSILYILMINYIQNNSDIINKYLKIFKLYIKYGIKFISSIYQVEQAEQIYRYINNEEDRFFMLMYIIEKYIKIEDKKTAIRYMLEVIHLNKGLIKYIEIYKDEILSFEEKDEKKNINKEFENYKTMIKKNIITLIDNKNLNDAKQIINDYEEIVKDDVEIYSIKAIIYTMEGDLYRAKLILEEGLRLYPENEDLLYNLNYLLNESDFNKNRKLLN